MCLREGCEKKVQAKGFCKGHYGKFRYDRDRANGVPHINYQALNKMEWTEEELEGLWQFVKKELKIV
jgi:hypothetical protein